MIVKLWDGVSLGRRYMLASCVYMALALLLLCTMPGFVGSVWASGGCEEGEMECGGNCIPEDWLCCDDGTSGDPATCACCEACVEWDCDGTCINTTSTIECQSS